MMWMNSLFVLISILEMDMISTFFPLTVTSVYCISGTLGVAVTYCCHGEEENKMMAIAQKCSLNLTHLPGTEEVKLYLFIHNFIYCLWNIPYIYIVS